MTNSSISTKKDTDFTRAPTAGPEATRGSAAFADRSVMSNEPRDPEFVAALAKLAAEKIESGAEADAEEILLQAVAAAESLYGKEHSEVALVLNQLARLQLKQSRFQAAEPTLLRLLDTKRAKGPTHPEVATVLASLAAVHRSLGRHESAEKLWRQVLDIRERSLAPNHFSTASAIEHLAEECEARGNVAEALSLLQRASDMRETLVGASHPSVQATRDRIADLQLRAAEDVFSPGTAIVPISTSYSRYSDIPRDVERSRNDRVDGAPVDLGHHHAAPSPVGPPESRQRWTRDDSYAYGERNVDPPISERVRARNEEHPDDIDFARLLGTDDESDTENRSGVGRVFQGLGSGVTARFSHGRVAAVAGAILVILVGGLFFIVPGRGDSAEVSPRLEEFQPQIVVAKAEAPSTPVDDKLASQPSGISTAPAPKPIDGSRTRSAEAPERRTESAARPRSSDAPVQRTESAARPDRRRESESAPITLPTVAADLLARVDSLATRAAATPTRGAEVSTVVPPNPLTTRRATFAAAESYTAQRARLIGELPTPKVPAPVADVEGEVRVRFNVDESGRPILESFAVVSSPNALLTEAVRKVIPAMRFEPARTGGPNPKPFADVVQIGFKFSRR